VVLLPAVMLLTALPAGKSSARVLSCLGFVQLLRNNTTRVLLLL
jgi:hypothetical protein